MKVVRSLLLVKPNFTVIRQYYYLSSSSLVRSVGAGASGGGDGRQVHCWGSRFLSTHYRQTLRASTRPVLGIRLSTKSAVVRASAGTTAPPSSPPLNHVTDKSTSSSIKGSYDDKTLPNGVSHFLTTRIFKKKTDQTIAEYVVHSFPASVQPYLRLSRMDKPIGTWLLFWPCTWGLALACTPESTLPSLSFLSLFGLGAFIMRGAGCTINDLWDKNIDSKVKRTVNRPLASGQLRSRHAVAWLASQLSISLAILCQLPEPCFLLGVGSLGLVILYPLAKRVTNWPQGVLGLTFNIGVLMGYTAAVAARATELSYLSLPWLSPSCLSLYLAGISWTLIYDTIYAHQDREEDTLLGLGSTAKLFGANSKYWLTGFSISMLSSLSVVGYLEALNWPYFVGLTASACHLAWQIKTLDINNNKDCAKKFTSNRHLGWVIFLSLLASH